jgi:hypothetical protein
MATSRRAGKGKSTPDKTRINSVGGKGYFRRATHGTVQVEVRITPTRATITWQKRAWASNITHVEAVL